MKGFEPLGSVRATLQDDAALAEVERLLRKRYGRAHLQSIVLANPERRAGAVAWHTDGFFSNCLTIARLCRHEPLTEFLTPFGIWRPELHVLYATPRAAVHRAPVSSSKRMVIRVWVNETDDRSQPYTKPTWMIPSEEPGS